jgi:hypothetical protein
MLPASSIVEWEVTLSATDRPSCEMVAAFHQCFCDNAAFIDGFIKTIEDTRRSIEAPSSSAEPPKAAGQTEKSAGSALAPMTTAVVLQPDKPA